MKRKQWIRLEPTRDVAARVLNVMDQEMGVEVVIILWCRPCTMKCKCKLKCNNPHNNGVYVHLVPPLSNQVSDNDINSDREDNELLPIIETQRETINTDSESDNDSDDEQE